MSSGWLFRTLFLVSVLTTVAEAQFLELNGSVDLSAVQAEVDGDEQNSLQQRYNVNASRRLTDAILARGSFRYFKFDLDQAEQLGVFREEVQPSGSLLWQHSLWSASATVLRRSVRTQVSTGRLITDNVAFDWATKSSEWPLLSLRYDWQEVDDTGDAAMRKSRDARLTARVDFERENESLDYTFVRRSSSNLLRDLDSRELSHQIRFLGSHTLDDRRRLRFDSQYLFTRTDRVDEVRRGSLLLEEVSIARAFAGVDPAPELGELDIVPGLSDGNTSLGTVPAVEIGAGAFDRNIGADLGFERDAVGAIFVYVDRVSSSTVTWSVYSSDDGLRWTEETSSPIRRFDPAFLRYEIEFPPVDARFVKVVNGGVNEANSVQVTEIEVFEAIEQVGEVERDAMTHLLTGSLRWRPAPRFDATAVGSARFEPQQGSVGDRESFDYGTRVRWEQTDDLQWSGRWEQAWQRFESGRATLRDDVVAATMLYEPLPTLGNSTSATWRRSAEGGREIQNVKSLFTSLEAEPIRALDVVVDGLVSRLENPLLDERNDIWTVRSSLDAEVTRSLRVIGSWAHQQTRTRPSDNLVIRRTWTLDVDLQFTERLFARVGSSWVEEGTRFSRRQDYLLNWRVGPRLVMTGQLTYDDASGGYRTERASFSATFDVNRRITAYLRYADLEQGTFEEERTMSWQQGLRMVF